MLIKLTWDPGLPDGRKLEKIVTASNKTSKGDIKKMFEEYIGIEFDEYCSWEVLDEF